jgi:hypothetical protein
MSANRDGDQDDGAQRSSGGDASTHFLHLVKAEDARDATPGCWFGGLPCLGGLSWPRGDIAKDALSFVAQIDLATIPRGPWSEELPPEGALAFFVSQSDECSRLEKWPYSRYQHKVVYVPEATIVPTDAPEDLPPLGGDYWERYLSTATVVEDAPRLLRHWPMRVVAQLEGYSGMDGKRSLIKRDIVWSSTPHGTLSEQKTQAVHPYLLIERYHEMIRSGLPPETGRGIDEVREALDVLASLIGDAGLFDLMPPETYRKAADGMVGIEILLDRIAGRKGNEGFRLRNNCWSKAQMTAMYDLIRHCVDTGSDLDEERSDLYRRWLGGLENDYHQAFGSGPFRGDDEPDDHSEFRLLARFSEDPALGWDTGGSEDRRFFIRADDLRAGRWDGAFVG